MPISHLRYTVEVYGRRKKILSISLRKKTGCLNLDYKPGPGHRSDPHGDRVDNLLMYKMSSFHLTKQSLSSNKITYKTRTANNPEERDVQFTESIKIYDRFAPVWFEQLLELDDLQMEAVGPADGQICLGRLASKEYNMIFGVFVGRRGRKFQYNHENDVLVNIDEKEIGEFRIIVLYMFFRAPSIAHGLSAHPHTTDPRLTPEAKMELNRNVMAGVDEVGAVQGFFEICEDFRSRYVQLAPAANGNLYDLGWSKVGYGAV